VSNLALERFGLAQVAPKVADIGPALGRALEHRPEPDARFARRPSTASLILSDERRSQPLPVWRVRTTRAIVGAAGALIIASWTLTAGASYSLVSDFVHIRPVTAVTTARPEVGVLVDAPASEIPGIASYLSARGIRASFAITQPNYAEDTLVTADGDQALPRLPHGGLVRWLGTGDQLHDVMSRLGSHHHFLYASSGPSVGQWWMAHGAGGRLVAGAVRLQDRDDTVGQLHPGEVIELSLTHSSPVWTLIGRLGSGLERQHLRAVPVGQLIRDAGASV
jgi:hypothetical protein